MQAKEEKMKAEVIEMHEKHAKQSSKIFKLSPNQADELHEEAQRDLLNWDKRSQI
jgi:hypothetical protein